ncbi:partial ATP-dependent RecD-like DNA helicase, partial [Gammaproteobacteria bacterium]
KSQGSEYRAVVIPLLTQHYMMLQRNLLYTAVTRAKELVVLVGTLKAIALAVKNNKIVQRNSRLAKRLQESAPSPSVSKKKSAVTYKPAAGHSD